MLRHPIRRCVPSLDPILSESIRGPFTKIFSALQRSNALKKFRYLDEGYLIALDGTGHFSSSQVKCNDCIEKKSRLKEKMEPDGKRAVSCLEKDLEALLVHYTFDRSYWRTLKTTHPIERVNKEFKRRSKSMDGLSERGPNCLLAFTALRLESGWMMYDIEAIARVKKLLFKEKMTVEEAQKGLASALPSSSPSLSAAGGAAQKLALAKAKLQALLSMMEALKKRHNWT